jgi:hypothetical protein
MAGFSSYSYVVSRAWSWLSIVSVSDKTSVDRTRLQIPMMMNVLRTDVNDRH